MFILGRRMGYPAWYPYTYVYIPGNADVTCAVDLTTLGSTATSNDSFVFSAASSPILQSVTPKRGGTGGGTPITMAGLNFGATQGSSSVSINGKNIERHTDGLVQDCSVSIANALEILQSCAKPSI